MRVEVVRSWDDARQIRGGWLDLLQRCGSSNPFLHPSFCELWMKYHDAPNYPLVIGLHGESGLTALAPLQIVETGSTMKLRRARFMVARPWFEVDFLTVKPDPGVFGAVLKALGGESSVPVAEFFALSSSSPSLRLLESAVQGTRMAIEYSYSPRWCNALVDMQGTWDSYYLSRPRKLRKNIRRATAQLRSQGVLVAKRYRRLDPGGRVLAAVDRVSMRSWKAHRSFSEAGFWEHLLPLLGYEGWLDLHTLDLDGEPIAFALLLRYGRTCYLLQTSYDAEYKAFSPGLLVILECLKALFEEGDPPSRLDFLSPHPYLARLSTSMGVRVKARVFMGGAGSMLVKEMFQIKRRVRNDDAEVFFRNSADLAMYLEKAQQVPGGG